ncbi:MAG: glycosyl transferase [Thermodesulfovibrio sp.]|nr:glycosyl transferase [Thermodesulfovibrio sp.]
MISVIIPTYNAALQLETLLKSLQQQTLPCEIIVIDSGSTDRTPAIAGQRGATVRVIDKDDFGHGRTRTLAGKLAQGDILVYLTQDALPVNTTSLERLLAPLADTTIGAVYGRQLPRPGAALLSSHLRLFNYPEVSYVRTLQDRKQYGIKTPFLSNSFAAYRKACLDEIGWFSEKVIMGEDTLAGARLLLAGYRLAYTAEAAVYHSHDYTLLQDFRRAFDIGVFHRSEDWLISEFGSAGSEGLAYLKSAVTHLSEKRKYHRLPELLVRTALKFTGYTLGRRSRHLPVSALQHFSMHRDWWD